MLFLQEDFIYPSTNPDLFRNGKAKGKERMMELGAYEYAGLIIGGIVIMLIVRMIIGWWRPKGRDQRGLRTRRPPPAIGMAAASIMATWFAAETLMGRPTKLPVGFQGVVFDPFGATMCLVIAGIFVVRLARRAKYVTIMDFFQHRYGKAMSIIGTVTNSSPISVGRLRRLSPAAPSCKPFWLAAGLGHDPGDCHRYPLHIVGRSVGGYSP